ncbi:MAG: zinc ribbon domain-containing protein [Bacteroidales bacterium]|nr:zinc ribbon domain-containing protein [Bacteroidales bacterium]MDD7705707.1 zinc ribbon domain-containing protein [Bacteroidales bacterium]MDY4706149.1 zinc ribbon domain-containing protein [Prevotella sp.]MDY4952521.1 zinc ribbon domain-containing protein [Prevotella sp.]MDY5321930.1 zinc ribbon domain-containing protein [Prevotella sp.]
MPNKSFPIVVFLMALLLAGCYSHGPRHSGAFPYRATFSQRQLDSLSFASTHHYSQGYNFVVRGDSIELIKQQPEELLSHLPTDSFAIRKHEHVVVADIRKLPNDTVDSIWVQLATADYRFGWVRESKMIKKVVPDDPISQFISTFSDVHLLIFLIVIVLFSLFYLVRKISSRNAHIVHFNDIRSFYPTLLCLLVACSAALYALIQMYAPEVWQHFYYHPTLNPFSQPPIMEVFLVSVWLMLIVGLAAVDDARHQLPAGEALLYTAGLAAVCAFDYIVFSLTTLYYIGVPLFFVYLWYALRQYYRHSRYIYICGNCGALLRRKGRCPHCGMMNE